MVTTDDGAFGCLREVRPRRLENMRPDRCVPSETDCRESVPQYSVIHLGSADVTSSAAKRRKARVVE